MNEFVHLHVHSQYSMLDGAIRVKDLIKRVSAAGMKAVALTDHANMFGAITLYKAAKEATSGGNPVQAILGCELDVLDGRGVRHMPLLASSLEGYKNLVHLVSMGHVAPPPDAPPGSVCVTLESLAGHTKGLVAMTGCMGGVLAQSVLEEGPEAGRKTLGRLVEMFEPGHLFVELQDHGLVEQPVLNGILVDLARSMNLPLVATNDVHYAERRDATAQMMLTCIKTGRSMDEQRERHHGSEEMYLKSPLEMAQLFGDHPDAIQNTLRIAEMCKLKLDLGNAMLPSFNVPSGYDTESYFRHVAREGLKRRFEESRKEIDRTKYENRLEMELAVICQMKFPGYFLIVWDFIKHAKETGVPVGPGRGSGAGSVVAWALRITDLDPIEYNLLFERFLNPERVSMPDFDIDFCMDRRDSVIAYVQAKYGEASVGQIATFAELKAKSVIKDVGRALAFSPPDAQQIANLIPRKTPAETYTIQESLTVEPKLKARFDSEPRVKELLELGSKLEGLTRHAGKHAAGIVISEGALWEHVPVFRDEKSGAYVTQYYKDDVEAAGLVKFDFLGLKTLTVLDVAQRLIGARPDFRESNRTLDLASIPLDDKATYALLASGETKGVFQLESTGMQQLFKDLRADCFEDIVAAVALYRPGPLGSGMVADFVARKNGRQSIGKMHPLVDHLLVPTYGVIVYQEQVMQVAQLLAGYTLGGADLLRRAMGKKKPEEMAKQKSFFMDGAKGKGVEEADAERIFALLEYFAGYGFNKCVVGETTIVEARTGERTTVADLYANRRPFWVTALGEDGKLRPRRVVDVMRNGVKAVFRLRTANGNAITATANHPFRTLAGWTNLEDLRVGETVAAAVNGDVVWDRIVSIEDASTKETFDLTVEIDHNFVADGLIVHNSHSAAYALLTYQTAYLKAHYPVEMLCAIMTADKDRIDKVVRTIADARAMGATVLPPDLNESDTDFKVVYAGKPLSKKRQREGSYVSPGADPTGPQIRFGLGAVRGVGGAALEAVFEARAAGPFRDLFDFAARVDAKRINKGVLESLVACGAFDQQLGAGISRSMAHASVDVALERSRSASRDREAGQTSMFGMFDAAAAQSGGTISSSGTYTQAATWDSKELLARERQSLGFYVSGHPLERYLRGGATLARLGAIPTSECNAQDDWTVVKLAGCVEGYRERIFKDGKLAFFDLEDLSGRVTVKLRNAQIESYSAILTAGEPVLLTGKVSFPRRDEDAAEDEMEAPREATILLNDVVPLSDAVRADARQLVIKLDVKSVDEKKLEKVRDLFASAKGDCPVVMQLVLGNGREALLALGREWRVEVGDDLFAGIERLFGTHVAELR